MKGSVEERRAVIEWLLDSDPSIRWQVMRDLIQESAEAVAAERARIATVGWGAQLLAHQSPDGTWWRETDPWPFKSTIFVLTQLMELGLDPASEEAKRAFAPVRELSTWWTVDGKRFFDGETEACINGRILATGAYFGEPSDRLVDQLLSEQLADGGWNCEAPPSKRSSFHSTICVLEGLLAYEQAKGANAAVTEARRRAEEYLLERRLFRSRSTGEVIDPKWLRFTYPTTYHYDVLRGLDYLRSAGVRPDERVAEAVALVAAGRDQEGRWPLVEAHADWIGFAMETEVGRPSRWITLRAMRVLDWAAGA